MGFYVQRGGWAGTGQPVTNCQGGQCQCGTSPAKQPTKADQSQAEAEWLQQRIDAEIARRLGEPVPKMHSEPTGRDGIAPRGVIDNKPSGGVVDRSNRTPAGPLVPRGALDKKEAKR